VIVIPAINSGDETTPACYNADV